MLPKPPQSTRNKPNKRLFSAMSTLFMTNKEINKKISKRKE